ncbi:MAG: HAMP domain-containing histidine kinase, partial [Ruminococcus sp.]|nr:HAMP domain-containing histidine kinase [Ruminococcus sp.]
FFDDYYNKDLMLGFYKVVYPILFGMTVLAVDTLIIRVKCRSFWKTTLLWTMISIIYGWLKKLAVKVNEKIIDRDMLRHDKFTRRFILRAIIFSAIEFLFIVAFVEFNAYFALFVISTILVAGYIFLSLSDLKAICNVSRHISAINQGDYTVHDESKFSPAYCMTEKLNNISAGIQSAVDRQLKSERMKIDLVTNVSHDLKTPLTSIISYIDLLSMEELSPTAKDYVNIIVNKSQRLKTMVADLFDLAKATSRTDIDMEKIDAVILTNQVLADLSDKIDSSGKQVKTDMKSESASIMADGKKMYRVLQNMIDNALKYSLDGTRIYLTLKNELGYCIITVKNIASYEMNFAPDEIMERFTRGDESRSTDGNGLGLSIAKSFTEACGGMFKITIDGDLFIAEVKIPVITIETYKETTDITNE